MTFRVDLNGLNNQIPMIPSSKWETLPQKNTITSLRTMSCIFCGIRFPTQLIGVIFFSPCTAGSLNKMCEGHVFIEKKQGELNTVTYYFINQVKSTHLSVHVKSLIAKTHSVLSLLGSTFYSEGKNGQGPWIIIKNSFKCTKKFFKCFIPWSVTSFMNYFPVLFRVHTKCQACKTLLSAKRDVKPHLFLVQSICSTQNSVPDLTPHSFNKIIFQIWVISFPLCADFQVMLISLTFTLTHTHTKSLASSTCWCSLIIKHKHITTVSQHMLTDSLGISSSMQEDERRII